MTGVRTIVVVAYLPVINWEITRFLEAQKGVLNVLWVLDPKLVEECCPDIADEAISPMYITKAFKELFGHVRVADRFQFKYLGNPSRVCIIMPDNHISQAVAHRYLGEYKVVYVPIAG